MVGLVAMLALVMATVVEAWMRRRQAPIAPMDAWPRDACPIYVAFMPKAAVAARSAQRPRLRRLHTVAPPHSQPWERKPSLSAAAAFGLRNVTYALSSGLQSGFTWAAQDCTTATRWLVVAWTVLSWGARATWPMCRNDDISTLCGPSRL